MLSHDEDSLSEGSIEELTESDIEDDRINDYTTFSAKYMTEITNLLNINGHVNCENALALNKEMQQRLQEVRNRLQSMLHAVKQRYISNEERLKLNLGKKKRGYGMRGAYLKGGTFFFKGNMFFKDINCRNCPNNQDYVYRKNEGEIFPMDFNLSSRHVWSLLDKKALVQAVKEQLIDYLADCKVRDKNKKSKDLPLQVQVHTEKLSSLLSSVDESFKIDWEEVSAHNLHYRHSPSSCKTMWMVYLHPSLKRGVWSAEENKQLLLAAQKHNYQDWQTIAKSIPKRSDYQCFIQYQTNVCFIDTKRWGRWDKRDDAKLLELVQTKTVNGVVDWNLIASYFPHKPKKSLHTRYAYYLDPKFSHAPFTPEEDLVLLAAVEEYGEKFGLLPRALFPNRSITQLRMRYKYTLKNRHTIAPWTVEDDKKLIEFVAEHGTTAWIRCAEVLGNHNRISCRTRYHTIKKSFDKNPNTTLEDIPRKKTCVLRNSVITPENWVEKVAELRENPETVLAPTCYKQRKAQERLEKKIAKAKLKSEKKFKFHKAVKSTGEKTKSEKKFEFLKEVKSREDKTKSEKKFECLKEVKATGEKTKRKVMPYVERLRAVEQKLYHYFKYAYNFRLGTDVCTTPPNANLCEVARTLHFQTDSTKHYNHDTMLSWYIRRRCKYYLQRGNQLTTENVVKKSFESLPPSWPTALAFRALCVQAAQLQSEVSEIDDKDNDEQKPTEINCHEAVQRFRHRMHILFSQTALLSRLEPERYNDLVQNTSSVPKVTETSITIDESTQGTTTSASEQQAFDLSCVKHEFPAQLASSQDNSTLYDTLPRIEIRKKVKKVDTSVVSKRKRTNKLKVSKKENETTRREKKAEAKKESKTTKAVSNKEDITSLSTTHSSYNDNNSQTSNISAENNRCQIVNQLPALQQQSIFTYTVIKQEDIHSCIKSTILQPEASISMMQENLTPQPQQKKKARKSKLVDNLSSEAAPADKRVCIDAELKLSNIKTEYEI
ncbi:uncharacterized protein Pbp95 [Eurosta solidaginis]|uniref:uncharacterized protein Pbp95 n=1 Tax=Eurosta solidaginis TaxID=178769 RepID=UPI00353063E4